LWFEKCGLAAPKTVKNGNFWKKIFPKGKFWGSIEKVEYRCKKLNIGAQLQTFLYAMAP